MTPYHSDDWLTVYAGDCREVLRAIPSESIHCVVTSPPYWGLRDYGIEPSTWGGDGACSHEWGDDIRIHKGGPHGEHGALRGGSRAVVEAQADVKVVAAGAFCRSCQAWRGAFGLEPTPELYVEHMLEVFGELRRVLRLDGTAWLNLGDSYATGAGSVGEHPGGGTQGERWKAAGSHRSRHYADGRPALGPMTQPNRMPIPGLKPKDLVGIPWRVAFALQAAGWWLRSDIVWSKPNPMPESVTDRPTKSHEYLFLLARSERYYYDAAAIREPLQSGPADLRKMIEGRPRLGGKHVELDDPLNAASKRTPVGRRRSVGDPVAAAVALGGKQARIGEQQTLHGGDRATGLNARRDSGAMNVAGGRNRRSVWTIPTVPYPGAHFAVFPPALVEPCIQAGCPEGGTVMDPFAGSGTVGLVANRLSRRAVLIDLNPAYIEQQMRRNAQTPLGIGG